MPVSGTDIVVFTGADHVLGSFHVPNAELGTCKQLSSIALLWH